MTSFADDLFGAVRKHSGTNPEKGPKISFGSKSRDASEARSFRSEKTEKEVVEMGFANRASRWMKVASLLLCPKTHRAGTLLKGPPENIDLNRGKVTCCCSL
jgi:hypothetical protein